MEKKTLRFETKVKALMVSLLVVAIGMIHGYSQNFTFGDLNYSVNTNGTTVTLRGHVNGTSASGELTIPETVTNEDVTYIVTAIGNQAFLDCSGFTGSLLIPNSITQIGESAFKNCTGLNGSLTIGTGVVNIDKEAFANTNIITVLFNPTNCTKMGYDYEDGDWYGSPVFKDCPALTTLIIGDNVKRIPVYAFENCSGLTGDLNIPNSVTTISLGAFYECSGFDGILTIGNSVTGIGSHAFYHCSNFVGVYFNPISCQDGTGGELTFIDAFTLSNAFLVIGDNVTRIPSCLFSGGGFSGNLTIPNSVKYIGDWAFMGNMGFTGSVLTIGRSVQNIGYLAFANCGFSEIHYNATNCSDITPVYNYFGHRPPFEGCYAELTIGENVTSIPSNLFRDQGNNHGIIIGSLAIPNSVKTIGDCAFSGNVNLSEISPLPDSLISIGENAFQGTGWYSQQPNGILYLDNWCLGYKGAKPTGNLVFLEGIKGIANGAFRNCSGLIGELSIPNSIIRLPQYVFYGCSGLTGDMVIPNSVTMIGSSAFEGCIGLTGDLVIPNSVTEIGSSAFSGCYSLTEAIVFNTTPPSLGYTLTVFYNTNFPFFVPYESLEIYKEARVWRNYASRIYSMKHKTIPSYSSGADNWHFIASPLVEETTPTIVDNLITETPYDLYQFNQSATDGEWQNYKANNFNLTNGQGYLYANAEETNIIFKGTFNEDDTKEIELAYDANANLAGWNLVGNPFPVSAYANRSYYVMNEEGTAIEPVAVSMETAIPTCTGVMVKADNVGETVTFSKTALRGQENQGVLQIAVAQAETRGASMMDKAIVSFNSDDRLEKFVSIKDNAQLYIPRGKDNYAIVNAEKTGEMPLNFEAKKNGSYTITVDAEMVDMDYLHLIDNLTGNDVDLLVEPSYTFESKTTDYASRFRLVFSASDAGGEACVLGFAFINGNGNLSIFGVEGEATLQVVDLLGHVIGSETFSGSYEKKLNVAPGVYMLRLINGDDVKVQKMVFR